MKPRFDYYKAAPAAFVPLLALSNYVRDRGGLRRSCSVGVAEAVRINGLPGFLMRNGTVSCKHVKPLLSTFATGSSRLSIWCAIPTN